MEPTRRTSSDTITGPDGKAKRSRSLEYYIPVDNISGIKVRVCKSSFLSTLGLKTDGRITEFVRQKTTLTSSPTIDRRGRWVRKEEHMIDKEKLGNILKVTSLISVITHVKMHQTEGILIQKLILPLCLMLSKKNIRILEHAMKAIESKYWIWTTTSRPM